MTKDEKCLSKMKKLRIMPSIKYALIAQLDRALGYELRGREFESLSAPLEELTARYELHPESWTHSV